MPMGNDLRKQNVMSKYIMLTKMYKLCEIYVSRFSCHCFALIVSFHFSLQLQNVYSSMITHLTTKILTAMISEINLLLLTSVHKNSGV